MPKGFQKGEGGRPKGCKNKRTRMVEEIADQFELDPFQVLMMIACNDWKGLGYASSTKTVFSMAGIESEEPVIGLSDRLGAAKEATKYIYSQKRSVELSTDPDKGIKIILEDYTEGKRGTEDPTSA